MQQGVEQLPNGSEWLLLQSIGRSVQQLLLQAQRQRQLLQQRLDEISHSSHELEQSAALVTRNAEGQSESATVAAAAAEQLNVSIVQVAGRANESRQTSVQASEQLADSIDQLTNRVRHVRLNIRQLSLLRALIAGFQHHRGLSNGVLCGDQSLSQDLALTRQQLDRHIRTAQELAGMHQDAWNGLIDHWSRLRDGRNSDLANNLLQHHLIIRNSIFLMEDVATEVDLTEGREELGYLPCIWREVLQAAE